MLWAESLHNNDICCWPIFTRFYRNMHTHTYHTFKYILKWLTHLCEYTQWYVPHVIYLLYFTSVCGCVVWFKCCNLLQFYGWQKCLWDTDSMKNRSKEKNNRNCIKKKKKTFVLALQVSEWKLKLRVCHFIIVKNLTKVMDLHKQMITPHRLSGILFSTHVMAVYCLCGNMCQRNPCFDDKF